MIIACDVAVIGAGAAGAVVAAELSARGARVVVLEEGPRVGPDDRTGDPAAAVRKFYRNGGAIVSLGRVPIPVQVGRAVGGSTVINGGTCFRTPDQVLAEWSRGMAGAFQPDDMGPYFERVERELHVNTVREEAAFIGERRVLAAARARGDRAGLVQRNTLACQGTHLCPFVCPTGAKQSVELSFLARAEAQGTTVLADTTVERILMQGPRAVGVLARRGDVAIEVRADVVALCAGALHSPVLLRKSLGDLTPRAAGASLFLHPGAHVAGLFAEEIGPRSGPIQSIYVNGPDDRYVIYGMGYPPEVYSVFTLKSGADLSNLPNYHNSVMLAVMAADHRSRGRIVSSPLGPLPLYRLDQAEAQSIVEGMAHAAELLFAIGAREVHVSLRQHGVLHNAGDAAALRKLRVRQDALVLGSVHPMGTAPMGLDPEESVVDANLAVHGVEGLFLPDASFFPTSLGVNPQITIMAFAMRAAEKMGQRRDCNP